MKWIILPILVIGMLLFSTCTNLTTTYKTIQPLPEASAIVTMKSYKYLSLIDYLEIYYDIKNNGNIYLTNYKIYFDIKCDDGRVIEYVKESGDVFIDETWSNHTSVEVEAKEVTSVEITKIEVEGGAPPEVMYEITGTAKTVGITLNNPTGGTNQFNPLPLPFRIPFYSFPDNFVYISAQNLGEEGNVKVSIYLNGELFKTSSSSGAYVIATASGIKSD